jgi:hypothetical protein
MTIPLRTTMPMTLKTMPKKKNLKSIMREEVARACACRAARGWENNCGLRHKQVTIMTRMTIRMTRTTIRKMRRPPPLLSTAEEVVVANNYDLLVANSFARRK